VWSVNNATEKSRQIMKKQKTKPLRSKNCRKEKKRTKNSNFVSAQHQQQTIINIIIILIKSGLLCALPLSP
jgi:hypothetical protein